MALKSISFATLLQMGGNGGVGGDVDCTAIADAGLTVPTDVHILFPPTAGHGESGDITNEGGNTQTQDPCGLQDDDPTVPTVPTGLELQATEPPVDPKAWRELASAYNAHHFNCPICIAAGRGTQYGQRCGVGMALWRAYST